MLAGGQEEEVEVVWSHKTVKIRHINTLKIRKLYKGTLNVLNLRMSLIVLKLRKPNKICLLTSRKLI